jgi:hypothetical protein
MQKYLRNVDHNSTLQKGDILKMVEKYFLKPLRFEGRWRRRKGIKNVKYPLIIFSINTSN